MIRIENVETVGWNHAVRGMRNPMNSWAKSDSRNCVECLSQPDYILQPYIGSNDLDLATRLAKGGSVHAKYRRMIAVYVDITAPLYWWKEFDTYKVGTVANSCSTMHKIAEKEFVLEDFSCEHLTEQSLDILRQTIQHLNMHRAVYLATNTEPSRNGTVLSPEASAKLKKDIWWQMIQLLPSSYNQKRTIMLNYEVLAGIYPMRKDHKLDEWRDFCGWIEKLPYSELITGKENGVGRGLSMTLKEAIQAVSEMDSKTGVAQSIYVIEECSELIKELTKKERGKVIDANRVIDEACDVLTTIFVLLYRYDVSEIDVKKQILFKCNRALERFRLNGET